MKSRRSKFNPRLNLKIGGRWVAHQDSMIRILLGLSLSARRILDRLEIEHCRHGRRQNGRLICTYADFERAGIQRSCIRAALDELISAGLIEIVRPGRRSYADLRMPSAYRLTFEPTFEDGKPVAPTHEWKQKARPESTTGAGPESTTGNGQLPDRNPPLREGDYRTGIHHSLSRSRVEGGGGAADSSCLPASPLAHHLGTGLSAPSPLLSDDPPSVTAPSSGSVH
jgi:hypothetical protein